MYGWAEEAIGGVMGNAEGSEVRRAWGDLAQVMGTSRLDASLRRKCSRHGDVPLRSCGLRLAGLKAASPEQLAALAAEPRVTSALWRSFCETSWSCEEDTYSAPCEPANRRPDALRKTWMF